tara:strand:- start:2108 stop:2326 length:219 start_codon:yes stop_codon:yes gene_type:complete
MKYSEIKENYSPERDEHNSIELDDTRKNRLTLTHLNDLRKMREYRKVQNSEEKARLKQQYGGSSEQSSEPEL